MLRTPCQLQRHVRSPVRLPSAGGAVHRRLKRRERLPRIRERERCVSVRTIPARHAQANCPWRCVDDHQHLLSRGRLRAGEGRHVGQRHRFARSGKHVVT